MLRVTARLSREPSSARVVAMRITGVKTTIVRVPLRYAAKWSGGTRETAPAILVEIETDEGLVGLGEGVGPTIPTLETVLREEFRPMILGIDPMRTEWIVHRLEELAINWAGVGAYGIAAIEMALLDLKGKALGTP